MYPVGLAAAPATLRCTPPSPTTETWYILVTIEADKQAPALVGVAVADLDLAPPETVGRFEFFSKFERVFFAFCSRFGFAHFCFRSPTTPCNPGGFLSTGRMIHTGIQLTTDCRISSSSRVPMSEPAQVVCMVHSRKVAAQHRTAIDTFTPRVQESLLPFVLGVLLEVNRMEFASDDSKQSSKGRGQLTHHYRY